MKKARIIIPDMELEDLKKIANGEFEVVIEQEKPEPIKTAVKAFGALDDGILTIVGWNQKPVEVYLVIK